MTGVFLALLAGCGEQSPAPAEVERGLPLFPDAHAVHTPERAARKLPDFCFVAVVDSGIFAEHPLFESRFADAETVRDFLPETILPVPGKNFLGFDILKHEHLPVDRTGHGTHMAGILVRVGFAEAPGSDARLLILRTGDKKHALSALTRAVVFLVNMKRRGFRIPVVLLPLEYYPVPREAEDLDLFEQALAELLDQKTLVVCAAGNRGQNNDVSGGASHCFPSDFPFPDILSVAACHESGHLHVLSNYGAVSVDLAAPGFGVESATLKGGMTRETGSSQAAAYVAARALLLYRSTEIRKAGEIKAALMKEVRLHPSLVGHVLSNGYLPRSEP